MNCPHCRAATYVTNSRPTGDSVRRRRKCPKCGRRLTTFESPIDLPNLFLTLKARLRSLEEEVGNVVDVAAKYMNGRLRRSKRGPSQSLRVNDLLNRRQRVKMNEAEVARLAEAYRSARDQRDLANDLGITTTQLRYRLYKHGITKRRLPNGAETCPPISSAPTSS